jgi:hypothetical protein
MKEEVNKFRDS